MFVRERDPSPRPGSHACPPASLRVPGGSAGTPAPPPRPLNPAQLNFRRPVSRSLPAAGPGNKEAQAANGSRAAPAAANHRAPHTPSGLKRASAKVRAGPRPGRGPQEHAPVTCLSSADAPGICQPPRENLGPVLPPAEDEQELFAFQQCVPVFARTFDMCPREYLSHYQFRG